MARNRITVRDQGADRVLRAAKTAGGEEVRVGLVGPESRQRHEGTSMSVAAVASLHELGLAGLPARPIVRAWADGDQAWIKAQLRDLARDVLLGRRSERAALEEFGERSAQRMRAVLGDEAAPLDPDTIRQKSGRRPLEETGQIRDAIGHAVEAGGR